MAVTILCPQCEFINFSCSFEAANDNSLDPSVISVTRKERLLDFDRHHRLATAASEIKAERGLSRRGMGVWLADTWFFYEGPVVWWNGKHFCRPETLIEDAFPDGSFRWMSDFIRLSVTPLKQRPDERILPKTLLLDVAIKIEDPDRARWIEAA